MTGRTTDESTDSQRQRHLHAPVPMLEMHVHRIELPAPSLPSLPRLPRPHVPAQLRPHVDPRSVRGRAMWLGGLGGLAVVGVLDWPVAAAVAAGTWVAERRARAYLAERQAAPPEAPAASSAAPTATATRRAAPPRQRGDGTRRTAGTGSAGRRTARKTATART